MRYLKDSGTWEHAPGRREHFCGFMSGIFDFPFDVTEVQCVTEGDEVCSFCIAITENPMPEISSRSPEGNMKSAPEPTF